MAHTVESCLCECSVDSSGLQVWRSLSYDRAFGVTQVAVMIEAFLDALHT